MKHKKVLKPELRLVAIGLLLVTMPFLINDWIPVPDFVRGALMGIGIGLEIIGLIRINRRKKAGVAQCE